MFGSSNLTQKNERIFISIGNNLDRLRNKDEWHQSTPERFGDDKVSYRHGNVIYCNRLFYKRLCNFIGKVGDG